MPPIRWLLVACVLLVLVPCQALAQSPSRLQLDRANFDRGLVRDLAVQAPDAVALFEQAAAARERGAYAQASELYARVRALAPHFDAAWRRQCDAETQLGHRQEALELCRTAVTLSHSAYNLVALAKTLATNPPAGGLPTATQREARDLMNEAIALQPDDPSTAGLEFEVGMQLRDPILVRDAAGRLQRITPEDPNTWMAVSIADALRGRFDEAFGHLDHARALGLPEATYRNLRARLEASEPWYLRAIRYALYAVCLWALGLLALYVLGQGLSRLTLRVAAQPPVDDTTRVQGLAAWLRRLYAAIVGFAAVYYYASLPIVVLIVCAVGGGLLFGILSTGYVPIKAVAVIAALTLATLGAIFRSLFTRVRVVDPGVALDVREHPRLRALLDEVAREVGTRPVDRVFLTPDVEIGVSERGGLMRQMRGDGERCMVLGVGVLEGFRLSALRAVLAHEYGHFTNRDTAGGQLALPARVSMHAMMFRLAKSGAAGWYNPAWLFAVGYYRLFLRISQGASRLQEVQADRWAAMLYGAEAFEEGLRHVIRRAVEFNVQTQATLREVLQGKLPLRNLYAYVPTQMQGAETVAEAVDKLVAREPSAYDSHPSPVQRFAWVRALPRKTPVAQIDGDEPAWSLFADREAIERMLTGVVRENILRNHGTTFQLDAS